ncbi:MAG: ATP-binding protein [Bacteroidales bacterium]|nr:ATP-binding protein [Bacteroidales bacterium]
MQTLNDDIIEYSQTLELLQKENLALKRALRRHVLLGDPSMPGRLDDCDLSGQLRDMERMFDTMFSTLQVPAFAGELIFQNECPIDFVFTKINNAFAGYFHLEPKDVLGKSNKSLSLLKSKFWLDTVATCCKTLDAKNIRIMDGDDVFNASMFSVNHNAFVAHFVADNMIQNDRNKEVANNLKFTQMMIDAIPTPLFYKDMEGRYLLCNREYAKSILGVSPEIIVGKTAMQLESIFPRNFADFYQEKDLQLIEDKGIQSYEGPIKCADGVVREYIINKTLIKDDNGKFVGILGVMQDIDRLLKARRDLAESENRYKALFNGINQPIIVVDRDGNIVMLNSTAIELFDNQDVSTSENMLQMVPAQALVNMEFVNQVYESGLPVTHRINVEVNGQDRCYMSSMRLINDFFGEKVVQIISNDITEIKRYQTELWEQKRRAEDLNNLKSVFLSNIAHETRTPANIISGLVQMIQSGIHKDKHSEYLNSIYSNCKKLLDIIDDIVELSKIETGQIKIRHEICSINNIIENAFVYLQDTLQESGKQLELLHSAPINEYKSLVYADSQFISQTLKKLISNAVTFTSTGSISIGAHIDDKVVTFYVKDTGIGIPQSKLSVIFERFRQGDEGVSRKYGGTGLGLAIVNELVNAMGGIIEVDSCENKGSEFRFSIPYERAGV